MIIEVYKPGERTPAKIVFEDDQLCLYRGDTGNLESRTEDLYNGGITLWNMRSGVLSPEAVVFINNSGVQDLVVRKKGILQKESFTVKEESTILINDSETGRIMGRVKTRNLSV